MNRKAVPGSGFVGPRDGEPMRPDGLVDFVGTPPGLAREGDDVRRLAAARVVSREFPVIGGIGLGDVAIEGGLIRAERPRPDRPCRAGRRRETKSPVPIEEYAIRMQEVPLCAGRDDRRLCARVVCPGLIMRGRLPFVHDQFYSSCKRQVGSRSARIVSGFRDFYPAPSSPGTRVSWVPLPSSTAPIFLWFGDLSVVESPFFTPQKNQKNPRRRTIWADRAGTCRPMLGGWHVGSGRGTIAKAILAAGIRTNLSTR